MAARWEVRKIREAQGRSHVLEAAAARLAGPRPANAAEDYQAVGMQGERDDFKRAGIGHLPERLSGAKSCWWPPLSAPHNFPTPRTSQRAGGITMPTRPASLGQKRPLAIPKNAPDKKRGAETASTRPGITCAQEAPRPSPAVLHSKKNRPPEERPPPASFTTVAPFIRRGWHALV